MLSDAEISRKAEIKDIREIGKKISLFENDLILYGKYKAKINIKSIKDKHEKGKLILVTAITPTQFGEGKTMVSVGLADSLNHIGKSTIACLREPSMGPVFGMKGGACGGGNSQIVPMQDINLHFTGDMHAIAAANNLLSALISEHIYRGNFLGIDPHLIYWNRAIDVNDRCLRNIITGIGGRFDGVPLENHFSITAASEIMAIFCLADSIPDLKERISKIVVAFGHNGEPITAAELNAQGALTAILKDAFMPNLVQSIYGTPAIIHGGPFANIAHGCSSVIAAKTALRLGDFVVTEAGFGADLGAEKFVDIFCRKMDVCPSASVLVVTVRGLKHHGGCNKSDYTIENLDALQKGFCNLERHVKNVRDVYGIPTVVAINKFATDTNAEIDLIIKKCENLGVKVAITEFYEKGGAKSTALAEILLEEIEKPQHLEYVYALDMPIVEKIKAVATKVYGASNVNISARAQKFIDHFEKLSFKNLPICIAKTQYSFSDNQKLLGAPTGFTINVTDIRLSAGAGFIVVVCGDTMTMPSLPKIPAAEAFDVTEVDGDYEIIWR